MTPLAGARIAPPNVAFVSTPPTKLLSLFPHRVGLLQNLEVPVSWLRGQDTDDKPVVDAGRATEHPLGIGEPMAMHVRGCERVVDERLVERPAWGEGAATRPPTETARCCEGDQTWFTNQHHCSLDSSMSNSSNGDRLPTCVGTVVEFDDVGRAQDVARDDGIEVPGRNQQSSGELVTHFLLQPCSPDRRSPKQVEIVQQVCPVAVQEMVAKLVEDREASTLRGDLVGVQDRRSIRVQSRFVVSVDRAICATEVDGRERTDNDRLEVNLNRHARIL